MDACRWILVGAALVVVGGCASERTEPRYLSPPVMASCPAVDEQQATASAAPLPADFRPVSAAICTFDVVVKGWRWRSVQRSDGPLDELVSALRTPPPTRRERGHDCPGVAQSPMYIALIDASGRAEIPAIPADPCGFRLRSVDQAVQRLTWTTVESR